MMDLFYEADEAYVVLDTETSKEIVRWEFKMDNVEFKKNLQICTEKMGFNYYKKNYYYETGKLVVVINAQKSNYDERYYINYGFYIKEIHDEKKNPKINDCDVMGRFVNIMNDEKEFDFPISRINSEKLIECLDYNMTNIIFPVIKEGIKRYFELYPKAILTAKRNLKDYLEGYV